MDKDKGLFENYSSPDFKLSEDFEDRVFNKIKVKKRRKKIVVSTIGGFVFAAIIFVAGNGFVFKNSPAVRFAGNEVKGVNDVMLTDDIVLATFDGRNSYIVEDVGLSDEDVSL